ncbi:MAG: sensor histidine kinase [Thermoanaerobacteraceae bacterium]
MLYKKMFLSYILIIVIPLIIIAFITGKVTSDFINEEVKKTTLETLNQSNKNISKMMENLKDTLLFVSMNRELQSNLTKFSNNTSFEINKQITAIRNSILYPGIFNENYNSIEIYAIDKPDYPDNFEQNNVMSSKIVENKEWYKKTLELKGKLYWFVNNDFGFPLISVARVVTSVKDFEKPIAVISVDLDLQKIAAAISGIKISKSSVVYLCNNEGNIIYPEGKNFNNDKKLYNQNSGSGFFNNKDGKEMYIYNTIPQNQWKIIAMIPLKELNEKADALRNYIYMLAFVVLIISALFSLYFSYTFSKPIIMLANKMESIKDGNLDVMAKTEIKGEIGILYSSFNYMIKRINDLIHEVYLSKLKKKEAELKALQAQINPHFLYNTLDSINWIALRNNVPDISKMVNALASILRYSLNKGNEIISIQDEIKQVESYIIIQKIRFRNKFDVYFDIDKKILNYKTIKLILQPLVENALIHGIETYEGKGYIKIKGFYEHDNIIFEIINNGNTIDLSKVNYLLNSATEEKDSYGIQNVNERLKLYYGENFGLRFYINENNTIARISIPAQK